MDARAGDVGEQDGDDHAGKAGARAEIDPAPRVGCERRELGRIGDVARPHCGEARRGNEIGDVAPAGEQVDVDREPRLSFGRNRNQRQRAGAVGVRGGVFHVKRRRALSG